MTILCIHMQRAALYFGITASHRPTRLHGVCARHIHEPLNWMYIPLRWIFEVIDACRSSRSRCLHVTCMGYLYCWLTGPGAGAITYLCTAVVAWLQGSHCRTDDRWIAAYDCDICSHGKLCRPSVKFVIVDIFIRLSSNCWLMWFHETIDPRRTFSTCVQRLIQMIQLFVHFWHAPLGLRSAKRRRQSPERMILIHNNCFIQGKVIGF